MPTDKGNGAERPKYKGDSDEDDGSDTVVWCEDVAGQDAHASAMGGASDDAAAVADGGGENHGSGCEANDGDEETTNAGVAERDAYVAHFRQLLEYEREAEELQVIERLKKPLRQLEFEGVACSGLWPDNHAPAQSGACALKRASGIPFLAEVSPGRTVLLTPEGCPVSLKDCGPTVVGEVVAINDRQVVVQCGARLRGPLRLDLGPNCVAQRRLASALTLLERASGGVDPWQCGLGLLSPRTPLATAVFGSIDSLATKSKNEGSEVADQTAVDSESRAEADVAKSLGANVPLEETVKASISELARARCWDTPSPPWVRYSGGMYRAVNDRLSTALGQPPQELLNSSQVQAMAVVTQEKRQLTLIQGPPGTGKSATAVEIACALLRAKSGPIFATAFSNKGVDNITSNLWGRGVNVLRVGTCSADLPYSMDGHMRAYGLDKQGRSSMSLKEILGAAHVCCATCIGSGMASLDMAAFPFVILDEAAQVIEPAALLPLIKGSVQVVMVGDQCQLPATVLSREAEKAGLGVSLFERLIAAGVEVHMLAIQYRMHPHIAAFPSWRFYNSKLLTGVHPDMRPTVSSDYELGTVAFVHVDGEEKGAKGHSKVNPEQAICVRHLVESINCEISDIGVITPYSGQVSAIRQELRGVQDGARVQVASVDGFQGSEKEVIILSLVRANAQGDLGFVADWRRLNVSVTRAKRLLVVIGNLQTLFKNDMWRSFLGLAPEMRTFAWQNGGLMPLAAECQSLLQAAQDEVSKLEVELPKPAWSKTSLPLRPCLALPDKGFPLSTQVATSGSTSFRPPEPQKASGYLFVCSNSTWKECESLGVFAAPDRELRNMKRCIAPGAHLYILNVDKQHLIGTFTAAGPPERSIVRGAFAGKFNAQIRVAPLDADLRRVKVAGRGLASGPKSEAELAELREALLTCDLVDDEAESSAMLVCQSQSEPPSQAGLAAVPLAPPGQAKSGGGGGCETGSAAEAHENCASLVTSWAECALESAMLRCRKRKAVEAEHFELAQAVKRAETEAGERLATAKRRALGACANGDEWERLQQLKQKAIAEEDFDLASELKRKQSDLEAGGDMQAELSKLMERKRKAVEAEDYELAARLKVDERTLLGAEAAAEHRAAKVARRLLAARRVPPSVPSAEAFLQVPPEEGQAHWAAAWAELAALLPDSGIG